MKKIFILALIVSSANAMDISGNWEFTGTACDGVAQSGGTPMIETKLAIDSKTIEFTDKCVDVAKCNKFGFPLNSNYSMDYKLNGNKMELFYNSQLEDEWEVSINGKQMLWSTPFNVGDDIAEATGLDLACPIGTKTYSDVFTKTN